MLKFVPKKKKNIISMMNKTVTIFLSINLDEFDNYFIWIFLRVIVVRIASFFNPLAKPKQLAERRGSATS